MLAPFAAGMSHALPASFAITVATSAFTLLAGDTAEARRRNAVRLAEAAADPPEPAARPLGVAEPELSLYSTP